MSWDREISLTSKYLPNTYVVDGIYVPGDDPGLVIALRNSAEGVLDFWFFPLDMNNLPGEDESIASQYMGSLKDAVDAAGMFTQRDMPAMP